jgi:SHS2 domain-containing protein
MMTTSATTWAMRTKRTSTATGIEDSPPAAAAITYHGLKVEQDGEQWLAEVIVDI